MSVYRMKNTNENEIATAIKAGAVEGGADSMSFETFFGSTDVSGEGNMRQSNRECKQIEQTIFGLYRGNSAYYVVIIILTRAGAYR